MTHIESSTSHASIDESDTMNNKRKSQWDTVQAEVQLITDRLGFGVEAGIKDTVTAFRAYEFTTSQSCEGHEETDGTQGELFPWVEICAPEPEHFDDSEGGMRKELEHQWTIENLQQRQNMTNLLSVFYSQRETPFDARLTFDRIGAFGSFRVQSFGATIIPLLSQEEQHEKLTLYRKEMSDFTDFLKNEFLNTNVITE
ncbi:MAG: hypothetical protein HGB03_04035 [Candidatus Yonathbacteria bacterium]|nr:hypothetical protein [Candidatus Yonathbacteria bacterium]NTW47598.1 hypothetical protein [Candidatus Yonathbacteria bacterium]